MFRCIILISTYNTPNTLFSASSSFLCVSKSSTMLSLYLATSLAFLVLLIAIFQCASSDPAPPPPSSAAVPQPQQQQQTPPTLQSEPSGSVKLTKSKPSGTLPIRKGLIKKKFHPSSTKMPEVPAGPSDTSLATAVKSTGSGYYAVLIKQMKVKSVSQYGFAPGK